MKQKNIEDVSAILSSINTILAETSKESKEYEELTGDIKLIIHECIDKVNDESTKKLNELISDIRRRLNIESNGHKLDMSTLREHLNSLINDYLVDIYADENGKPRSTGDFFKFAVSQYVASHFEDLFKPEVDKDGKDEGESEVTENKPEEAKTEEKPTESEKSEEEKPEEKESGE
jgi:hypothetical protein